MTIEEKKVLHFLPVEGTGQVRIGPEEMKTMTCPRCGTLLFVGPKGSSTSFTNERSVHENPPEGYVRCEKKEAPL